MGCGPRAVMYNLHIENIRGNIPLITAVMLSLLVCTFTQAQVDYNTQVQPIFTRSCEGGFCHIDMATSGIDLSNYEATMSSTGFQYAGATVVPGDSQGSPLWLKIAEEKPELGARMPRLADPLSPEEIDLVAREGRALVFVEVKSTSQGSWSSGFERIDSAKRRSLRRACRAYLQLLPEYPSTYRLDVISVSFARGALGPRVCGISWEKGFFPLDG